MDVENGFVPMTKNQRNCVGPRTLHPYKVNFKRPEAINVNGRSVLGEFLINLGFPVAPVELSRSPAGSLILLLTVNVNQPPLYHGL